MSPNQHIINKHYAEKFCSHETQNYRATELFELNYIQFTKNYFTRPQQNPAAAFIVYIFNNESFRCLHFHLCPENSIAISYLCNRMHVYICSARPFISVNRSYVQWINEFMSFNRGCRRKKPLIYHKHFKIKWKPINCIWWIILIKRNINKKCKRHNLIIKMQRISTIQIIMEWFYSLLITHNQTLRLPHQTSKLIYSIFFNKIPHTHTHQTNHVEHPTYSIYWNWVELSCVCGENEWSENIFNFTTITTKH